MKTKKEPKARDIFPVLSFHIKGFAHLGVSSRDLHRALKIPFKRLDWMKSKIEKHRLHTGTEYIQSRVRIAQGQWLDDYYLTLSTAKSLCMLEGTVLGLFVKRQIVETELEIIRNFNTSFLFRIKKTGHIQRLDERVWYWTHKKIEMLLANGVCFKPDEIHLVAMRICAEIEEELDRDLSTEFSVIKGRGPERAKYVDEWKPEFAKCILKSL